MLHTVKKVEYIEGFALKLFFSDKTIKIVDLSTMLQDAKNMFIPLLDTNYFKQVECDGTTICWPNGIDLCPDVLYKIGKPVKSLKPKQSSPKQPSPQRKRTTKSLLQGRS